MPTSHDSTLFSVWVHVCQQTSAHGIRHAVNEKMNAVHRLGWALIVISFCAAFLVNMVSCVDRYFSFPLTTKYTYHTNETLPLPTLEVHQRNLYSKSYLEALVKNNTIPQTVVDTLRDYQSVTMSDFNQSADVYGDVQEFDIDQVEMDAASHHNDEWDCRMYAEGQRLKCPLARELHYVYIHPGTYIKQHGAVKFDEYSMLLISWYSDRMDYMSRGPGLIYVIVHSSLYDTIGTVTVPIEPWTDVNVYIKERDIYKLDQCVDTDDPAFINPLRHYVYYTQTNCKDDNRREYDYHKCGCVRHRTPHQHTLTAPRPVCKLGQRQCVLDARDRWWRGDPSFPATPCLPTCHTIEYTLETSKANTFLVQKENNTQDRFNVLVQFRNMHSTEIRDEAAYPLSSLLGEVGGMLGICLGASALTILEVIDTLFTSLIGWWNQRKFNRIQHSDSG